MKRFTSVFASLLVGLAGLGLFTLAWAQDDESPAEYSADVSYRLTTGLAEGKMVFFGVGGDIDGEVNPTLTAEPGDVVAVTLVNGDGVQHDVLFEGFANAQSDMVTTEGASSTFVFRANEEGAFDYYCTVPGHRQAGMEGSFVVGEAEAAADDAESIVRAPTDLPGPIADRDEPVHHDVTLTTVEKQGRLADGTSYRFWTFDGQVPGPLLRVRQNDTVTVTLENPADSTMVHSVDFHAVTGPGGGAVATQTAPGDATSFSFTALQPGLYVYHCATPMVAHHITNGMYGLILVEPEEGLAEVDNEFYVMQGELYTQQDFGQKGELDFNVDKLLDEQPEYYVFNGAVGALTGDGALTAETGESVRIFFGVGGPNKTSSFHVIGEIFERVYDQASLTSPPLTDVQTTTVAPGGATMVEFGVEVPGTYILVDHALSRAERGLAGHLEVSGEGDPDVYQGEVTEGSGH
ncbi:MAG: copper-containing nitrite reductase [Trueperaceae bacterium]|nr:copper-containing nitrite reductase [Trueperaceae bacterium]